MPRRLTAKQHIERTRAAFRKSGLSAEEFNKQQVSKAVPRKSSKARRQADIDKYDTYGRQAAARAQAQVDAYNAEMVRLGHPEYGGKSKAMPRKATGSGRRFTRAQERAQGPLGPLYPSSRRFTRAQERAQGALGPLPRPARRRRKTVKLVASPAAIGRRFTRAMEKAQGALGPAPKPKRHRRKTVKLPAPPPVRRARARVKKSA